ncbi:hypothetical protein AB0F25_14160 [Streptomyces wedmorensis]|uniref:hypothetical protein n=1 Tax=Streptomyces wedmorensis TaxID=43759 RepID=UPI00341AAAFD
MTSDFQTMSSSGMTEDMLELGFGVKPHEVYFRSLGGNNPPEVPERPLRIADVTLFPPRQGTLVEIPAERPVPDVAIHKSYAKPGTVMSGAQFSTDEIASAPAPGGSRKEVEDVLAEVHAWIREGGGRHRRRLIRAFARGHGAGVARRTKRAPTSRKVARTCSGRN